MGRVKKFGKGKYYPRRPIGQNSGTPTSCSSYETCKYITPENSNNNSENCTPGSASKRKLIYLDSENNFSVDCENNSSGFVVVDVSILSKLVQGFVKCKYCDNINCIKVEEKVESRRGLSSKLSLICTVFSKTESCMTSKMANKKYEINLRLAYGMRCIGKGQKAAQTFCAMMNLPPAPTKFLSYYKALFQSLQEVADNSMKNAAREAVRIGGCKDITAAFDASWQRRGHSSLNGVVTGTALDTPLSYTDHIPLNQEPGGCE